MTPVTSIEKPTAVTTRGGLNRVSTTTPLTSGKDRSIDLIRPSGARVN